MRLSCQDKESGWRLKINDDDSKGFTELRVEVNRGSRPPRLNWKRQAGDSVELLSRQGVGKGKPVIELSRSQWQVVRKASRRQS